VVILAKRLFVASVFVIPAVVGLTVLSAGASPYGQLASGASLVFGTAPEVAGPNSNLTGSGHSVVFSPTALSGAVVPQSDCTPSDDTFTITNDTPKPQKITHAGVIIVRIPAGTYLYACISKAKSEKFDVVSDPSTQLTVTAVAGT
jgi:hypothetical protein